MIDGEVMNINKQILSYCPNFYKIINFKPLEDDKFFERLVKIYQSYIFKINVNNEQEVNTVKELDRAIGQYISDYIFRKELKHKILRVTISRDAKDILKEIISYIISIFNSYEEDTTRVIYISRWI